MSEELSTRGLASSPTKPVALDAVERELAGLWQSAGREPTEEEPTTRACMSNLLIFCLKREQADQLAQELPTIVQLHPSRVLLMIGEGLSGRKER